MKCISFLNIFVLLLAILWGCRDGGGGSGGDDAQEDDDGEGDDDTEADDTDGEDTAEDDTGEDDTEDEEISCEELVDAFAACGGELEGTWRYERVCMISEPPNPFEKACKDADITASEEWEGTVRFDGETMVIKYETRERVYFAALPDKCLSEVLTCSLMEEIWQPTPAWTPSCLEGPGGCDCNVTVNRTDLKESFEYEQKEEALEIKKAGIEIKYCVDGNYLTVKQTEIQGQTSDDVVFYARSVRARDE